MPWLLLLGVVVLVPLGAMGWAVYEALKLPANRPETYLKRKDKAQGPLVVCAGDSLTHAHLSAPVIPLLETRFADQGFHFVNAGINSQLAYNLLQRIDELIACQPDFVTILIGTNDVNALQTPGVKQNYIKDMKLPQEPTKAWYEENLRAIIHALQQDTQAKIALISLPPLGEESDSIYNQRIREYNQSIEAIATQEEVAYLPFGEALFAGIEAANHRPKIPFEVDRPGFLRITWGIFRHHLLRQSYDAIADAWGFLYLTDHIHLNERAATILAQQLEDFLRS